jgi:prepilin-type N-terminal cleavage/methylation domain-containing protein
MKSKPFMKLKSWMAKPFAQPGFTLTELAVVLVIVTLLISGMLLPLSAQQDIRARNDTQARLAEVRDALIGFAIANDRLPCPASPASNGIESPVGGGPCTNPYDGLVPAVTLGLSPQDASGYLIDGWGGNANNRLRYAVTTSNTNAFTTLNGMRTTTMASLTPNLKVCNSGGNVTGAGTPGASCSAGMSLADGAIAIIYSLGKNSSTGGSGTDETHNPNPLAGVAADPAFVNAPSGETFDDQMLWLSPNTLYNRMVAAGRLP